jgi:hypothetical protein
LVEYKALNKVKAYISDPTGDEPIIGLQAPHYRTFFKALKQHGLVIYFDYVPHQCKVCLSLPIVNRKIKALQEGKTVPADADREMATLKRAKADILLNQA